MQCQATRGICPLILKWRFHRIVTAYNNQGNDVKCERIARPAKPALPPRPAWPPNDRQYSDVKCERIGLLTKPSAEEPVLPSKSTPAPVAIVAPLESHLLLLPLCNPNNCPYNPTRIFQSLDKSKETKWSGNQALGSLDCNIDGRPPLTSITCPLPMGEAYLAQWTSQIRPIESNIEITFHEIIQAAYQHNINISRYTCLPQTYRRDEMPRKSNTVSLRYQEIFSFSVVSAILSRTSFPKTQCQSDGQTLCLPNCSPKIPPPCQQSNNPCFSCGSCEPQPPWPPKQCQKKSNIGKYLLFFLAGLLVGGTLVGLYNKYACAICRYIYKAEENKKECEKTTKKSK